VSSGPQIVIAPVSNDLTRRLLVGLPWLGFAVIMLLGNVNVVTTIAIIVVTASLTILLFRWMARSSVRETSAGWLIAGRMGQQVGWLSFDAGGCAWRPRSVRREPTLTMPWDAVTMIEITPLRGAVPRCRLRLNAGGDREFALTASYARVERIVRQLVDGQYTPRT
jgi:hypothetical protein